MNIEYSGTNNQIKTTWGNETIDDIVVGKAKPVTSIVTCRCGNNAEFSGFGNEIYKNCPQGFVEFIDEYFCSYDCIKRFLSKESIEEVFNEREMNINKQIKQLNFWKEKLLK